MNASDAKPLETAPSAPEDAPEKIDSEASTEKNMEEDAANKEKIMNGSGDELKELRGLKRDVSLSTSSSGDSTDTKVKKARNKPKPVLIENMKAYVDTNTLEKLTTATLRHWLRQQSIHCTTRDKKADLVEKVCKHFVVS